MNIAVFGADGRSGQAFIKLAASKGHMVKAGVLHNPNNQITNCQYIHTDALNYDEVYELIEGCQAVVSLIGHVKNSSHNVQTQATKNIIRAMNAHKLTRLISLTGSGVRRPGDKITLLDQLLNFGVFVIDKARVVDGRNHMRAIEASYLDWTVLRVLKLTDGPFDNYVLSTNGPAKTLVSRATVADAIVKILVENLFVRQSPIIAP